MKRSHPSSSQPPQTATNQHIKNSRANRGGQRLSSPRHGHSRTDGAHDNVTKKLYSTSPHVARRTSPPHNADILPDKLRDGIVNVATTRTKASNESAPRCHLPQEAKHCITPAATLLAPAAAFTFTYTYSTPVVASSPAAASEGQPRVSFSSFLRLEFFEVGEQCYHGVPKHSRGHPALPAAPPTHRYTATMTTRGNGVISVTQGPP